MGEAVLVWLVKLLILLDGQLKPGGGDKEESASLRSRWSTVLGWSQQ